jgi:hypothetical protein
MTRSRFAAVCALLLISSIRALGAQTISVSGNPGLLRISTAIAGSEPTSVSDASRTFTVNTPTGGGNAKYNVSMNINANMPANVTLTATLAVPAGSAAVSSGAIALDVTPRLVLTAIKKGYSGTAATTYQLTAIAAAGVVPNSSRTVTYTITLAP